MNAGPAATPADGAVAGRDVPGPPRVAVLMSTYDGAAFLEAQLASLAAQEGVETALFVRDDGSSDATLSILAGWADRWPALAAVPAGPNLGPAMSFLTLLAAAPDGFDGYAFCDQDDVWLPDKLARAMAALAALPPETPALYCSQVTCVSDDLTVIGAPFAGADTRFEHFLFENIAYGITVVMNAAARRAVVARLPAGGVIMHDWWCALAVSALGTVIRDPRASVLYRQHGRNVIGAATEPLKEIAGHLRAFARNPKGFHPVHAQAAEFQRLFGALLRPRDAALTRAFVASKASVGARLRYALFGKLVMAKWYGALFARGLVMAGWY